MSQPGRSPGSFMPSPSPGMSLGLAQNNTSNTTTNFHSASATAAAADLPPPPHRPRMRRVESSSSEDSIQLQISKARSPTQQHHPHFSHQQQQQPQPPTPAFATSHANSSTTSLQNFSRPTPSPLSSAAAVAARSVAGSYDSQQQQQQQQRTASPMSMSSSRSAGHSRKHSQTAGVFEPTLPSISTSNLSTHVSMSSQQSPVQRELTASQIAAQAAVLSHQQAQQQQQQQQQIMMVSHSRQRSQTAPLVPSDQYQQESAQLPKRTSGPLNPPVLSLTEASAPRDTGFGSQGYHNGLLGSNAAATAANAAFPRSGQTSPVSQIPPQPPPPPPPPLPEKKPEKSSKMKLFSKPNKIGTTKGDPKDKPLPSPSKIGSALSALQRGNFSTTSLDTTAQSFYNMNNSSTATIRPGDAQPAEKEKRHHFLSRQRHKTKDKDDYHSQLSSAASNSRPTDPSAPTSLYNFKLPSSPGPNSSAFKNISGLGHGARARKKDDKTDVHDSVSSVNDWAGPGSLGSISTPLYLEPIDSAKYGLNSMSMDDAFPYLKSKLLVIFEGEDLRLPVEDFNRVVTLHIQYCIKTRSPMQVLDDLRDLLWTGFSSLDHNLRRHSEDHLIPNLVDLWMHVFTGVLPYMQAVFLPLDLEFSGSGSLLTPEQARDFWGGVITSPSENPGSSGGPINLAPASTALDVRRMVLTAYRDVVILPRYDRLKTIFSRLSLEFFPGMGLGSPMPEGASAAGSTANLSTSPGAESMYGFPFGTAGATAGTSQQRPGTAMSLDPSTASYNSTSTTLLGDLAAAGGGAAAAADASGRSRGLSNVSFASSGAQSSGTDAASLSLRPPGKLGGGGLGAMGNNNSSSNVLGLSLMREQSNVEDSKYVTDMVGRMLQCMSVLAGSAGNSPISGTFGDEGARMVEELGRLLKLNWLGRGRTGRNRRGIVGGRVARRTGAGAGAGTGMGTAEGVVSGREEVLVG